MALHSAVRSSYAVLFSLQGSPTYGYITTTPKPGWKNTDVLGPLLRVRRVPVVFDTDVNAPAMAEYLNAKKSAGPGGKITSCAYITVGTGIGVGLVVNGAPVHGLMHPEAGHVSVPRRAADASFSGSNPEDCFGGSCAENMACSKALAMRAGLANTSELPGVPDSHEAWEVTAKRAGLANPGK